MRSEIAFLDTEPMPQYFLGIEDRLEDLGYKTELYTLPDDLKNALSKEHWLAIANFWGERDVRQYSVRSKGGIILVTKYREDPQAASYFSRLNKAVDLVQEATAESVEEAIGFALAEMHLPSDFFRNQNRYCIDCLNYLSTSWRNSTIQGHKLSPYRWRTDPLQGVGHLKYQENFCDSVRK